MANMFTVLAVLTVSFTSHHVLSIKFPSGWKKCPKTDNEECLKEAIPAAVRSVKNGNQSLGIIPLDPLHFEKVDFFQGDSHAVTMNMTMFGLEVTGQKTMIVTSAKIDWDAYVMDIEFDLIGTSVISGNYTMIGKILVLPIYGKGVVTFTFTDLHVRLILTGSERTKKNKKYFNVDKGEFLLYPKKLHHNWTGLFDGSPKLAENMLKYLNDNWKETMDDVRGTVSLSIGEGIRQVANGFLSKVPVDQLYTK